MGAAMNINPEAGQEVKDGARLRVTRVSLGYAVMNGRGLRISPVFNDFARAEVRLDALEKRRRQARRGCLGCGHSFLSEGIWRRAMCRPWLTCRR